MNRRREGTLATLGLMFVVLVLLWRVLVRGEALITGVMEVCL
jgi:hypothetical protein